MSPSLRYDESVCVHLRFAEVPLGPTTGFTGVHRQMPLLFLSV